MLESFTAAFVIALLSEIADKTQLVILGLSLDYKAPFKVFLGALLAHSAMDGVAILLGSYFGVSLPVSTTKLVVGVIFTALGLWTLAKLYMDGKKAKTKIGIKPATGGEGSRGAFAQSFLTVALVEIGDKAQVSSALLAAKYQQPLPIFGGFVLALAIAIGLNVFLGSKVAEKIPRKAIKLVTGILFLIYGIASLA